MKLTLTRPSRENLTTLALIIAAILLLIGWLRFTPPGLLGKADAVGYAVCHRIAVRSFFFGERQFPLCSRCSGMYLGALAGLLYHMGTRRRGGMPPLKISVVLGLFVIAFGVDGVNSYLHFFPGAPALYQPQNLLRLLTGTGVGIGIAAMLAPVVRQTLWVDWDQRPALASWRQLAELIVLGGIVALAVLSENPLILYPLALLSSATVLAILTLVYTIVWVMLTKRDNTYRALPEVWLPLLAGFITALLQIALMDAARFAFTGTWEGFNNLILK